MVIADLGDYWLEKKLSLNYTEAITNAILHPQKPS